MDFVDLRAELKALLEKLDHRFPERYSALRPVEPFGRESGQIYLRRVEPQVQNQGLRARRYGLGNGYHFCHLLARRLTQRSPAGSLPGPEGHSGVHVSLVLLGADALLAKVNVLAPAAAG